MPENEVPQIINNDVVHPAPQWGRAAQQNLDIDWLFAEQNRAVFVKEKPKPDSNTTIEYFWGIKVPAKVKKVIASHPTDIIKGIELEIENFPCHLDEASAVGFSFTSDGSLRNNGVEAVSHPNNTIGLIAVTSELWKKYNITNNNYSDRTSIHVHANVLDFNQEQFKALTLLYQLVEELLFDFVGNDREDNIYCIPWYEAGVTARSHARILEAPRGWQKYTALNLQPVTTQGTVEFRHMHGHCDIEVLSKWLRIIDDLLLSAKATTYSKVLETIQNINTNSQYHTFLATTFPTTWPHLMSDKWEAKLARGVIEAKYSMV